MLRLKESSWFPELAFSIPSLVVLMNYVSVTLALLHDGGVSFQPGRLAVLCKGVTFPMTPISL